MIIADTNVWSETLSPNPDKSVVSWVHRNARELYLPAIARHELLFGVLQLPAGHRRDRLSEHVRAMLDRLASRTLAYDTNAADRHAEIRAAARASGRGLSAEDGQILGIASAQSAAVATRNTRDFAGWGVDVVDPWTI